MRMEMNEEESKRFTVLIVDNHSSRLNSYAIEYLIMHRIHVLTLPANYTYILQPIDISVASSFKSFLNRYTISTQNIPKLLNFTSQAAKNRYSIVYSIQKPWESITPEIIKAGFEKSGIYPLNPRKPLQNQFTHPAQILYNNTNQYFVISNKVLTNDFYRIEIVNQYYDTNYTSFAEIPKPLYFLAKSFFSKGTISDGFILYKLPSLFVRSQPSTFVKIIA